jgi:hypothetical protein
MTRDKFESLMKYLGRLEERAAGGLPAKHAKHPRTYKAFIDREIKTVKTQLEEYKLQFVGEKKK